MNQIKATTKTISTWVTRSTHLLIAISLGLVGMSLLKLVTLPELAIKFVGYLLIVSAVVYIYRNLK
jgi:hypothetical protein